VVIILVGNESFFVMIAPLLVETRRSLADFSPEALPVLGQYFNTQYLG
jgi:hypothetical protein